MNVAASAPSSFASFAPSSSPSFSPSSAFRSPGRRSSFGSSSFGFADAISAIGSLGQTVFPFVREGNRNEEVLRALEVRERVSLGQLGLTRGGVSLIPGVQNLLGGFPQVSLGGGLQIPSMVWVLLAIVLLVRVFK